MMGLRELHRVEPKRALICVAPDRLPQIRAVLMRHGVEVRAAASFEPTTPSDTEGVHLLIVDADDDRRAAALVLAARLKAAARTPVVVLTRRLTMPMAHELANVDADAVISLPIDARQLDATLQLLLARGERSSPRSQEREQALADALDRIAAIAGEMGYGRDVARTPALGPRLARLRPRERQVVQLLLAHHRVPAIARELAISAQTVRNHLKSAFKRSGTRSQQELLDWLTATERTDSAT